MPDSMASGVPDDAAGPRPVLVGPLPRGLLILLGLASATITIAGMKSVASIAAPAFLALVLAVAVHPIRVGLVRRGVKGWLATTLTIIAAWLILLVLAGSIVLAGAKFASLLPQYQDDMNDLLHDAETWLHGMGVGKEQASQLSSSLDLGKLGGVLADLLSSLLAAISNLFFIAAVLLFIVADGSWFPVKLQELREIRGGVVEALESFAHGTRAYLVVSTIFGLIVAVIDTGLLWVIGIPIPLVWGLLAFITNYIPNIGFILGLVPPAILALLEGGVSMFLVVVISYSVINVIIQTVIQPKVVGDAVGLSASLTFLALIFWAWVLGPLGALLAIPLSLLIKALLVDVDTQSHWLRGLISGAGGPSPAPSSPAPSAPPPTAPPPAAPPASGPA